MKRDKVQNGADWYELTDSNDKQYRVRESLVNILSELAHVQRLAPETLGLSRVTENLIDIENEVIQCLEACRLFEEFCLKKMNGVS